MTGMERLGSRPSSVLVRSQLLACVIDSVARALGVAVTDRRRPASCPDRRRAGARRLEPRVAV